MEKGKRQRERGRGEEKREILFLLVKRLTQGRLGQVKIRNLGSQSGSLE